MFIEHVLEPHGSTKTTASTLNTSTSLSIPFFDENFQVNVTNDGGVGANIGSAVIEEDQFFVSISFNYLNKKKKNLLNVGRFSYQLWAIVFHRFMNKSVSCIH